MNVGQNQGVFKCGDPEIKIFVAVGSLHIDGCCYRGTYLRFIKKVNLVINCSLCPKGFVFIRACHGPTLVGRPGVGPARSGLSIFDMMDRRPARPFNF